MSITVREQATLKKENLILDNMCKEYRGVPYRESSYLKTLTLIVTFHRKKRFLKTFDVKFQVHSVRSTLFPVERHIIKLYFVGLQDESVIARNAALFALGQFAEHVQVCSVTHSKQLDVDQHCFVKQKVEKCL